MECGARNPCKTTRGISNPDGVTEFCRAFGTYLLVLTFCRGYVLRCATHSTACLCSVAPLGLTWLPKLFGQTVLLPSFRRGWGRWSAPTREVIFCINKSKSALHIPRFPTEHASFHYGACFLSLRNMPPVVVGLCFRTRGAMLLDTESYAFGIGKQCF